MMDDAMDVVWTRMPVAVGLGSNLGDRRRNLAFALERLSRCLEELRCSRIYETEPLHLGAQGRFLNACCTGRTALGPEELLDRFQAIERAAGRRRGGPRFGPRALDVDFLLYGDRVIRRAALRVPHPRMAERAFVLLPLREVAADWVHPELAATVGELARRVPGEGVVVFDEVAVNAERGEDRAGETWS